MSFVKRRQILDELAARGLLQAMDEELARWGGHQMRYPGPTC